MDSYKVLQVVTPAKAGVQKGLQRLDSRLRGNDRKRRFPAFYETVTFDISSFRRKPESSGLGHFWTPVFTGVTA